jgi:uncharacterized membrane protein (DUF106 family)
MKLILRLIVLVVLMIPSLKSFSQNVTNTTSIPLETPLVRLIIKDLIVGDGFKQELSLTQDKVKILEQKVTLKDDIIKTQSSQIQNYQSIDNHRLNQLKLSQELTQKLQVDLKKQQFQSKLFKGTSLLGIAVVIFLIK